MDPVWIAVLVGLGAFALPLAAVPWLRRPGRGRWLSGAPVQLYLLSAAFAVPGSHPLAGFVAALFCALEWMKLTDLMLGGEELSARECARFLVHPGAVVVETFRKSARVPWRRLWKRGALGAGLCAVAGGLLFLAWKTKPCADSFLLDHLYKGVCFALLAEGLASCQHVVHSLAGLGTVPVIDGAFLARTPAEFWQRYNRWVCAWLDKHGFKRAGGRRQTVRATLWTFFISAAVHEWLFALALNGFDGYQAPFFLLHGLAVVASLPFARVVRRKRWAGWLGRVLTWVFLYLSSMLFFASGARVLPWLYDAPRLLP